MSRAFTTIFLALIFATASFGTEMDHDLERYVHAVPALGSGATVTYMGKTSDLADYRGWGEYGYYLPQFGMTGTKTRRTCRDNMVFSKPSWQKRWEWDTDETCGGDPCNLMSIDAGVFDVSKGAEGIGVETRTKDSNYDFVLPNFVSGNSGSTRDAAAENNTNNTVNHISMESTVPSEFCMDIITDNTAFYHNPADILAARIGWYPDQDYEAGTATVPSGDLTFNAIPDIYTFKFSNMTSSDFIKIRLKATNQNPGFGGLMFGSCGPCTAHTGMPGLASGQSLPRGQYIESSNGSVTLYNQTDGHLVLYRNSDGAALWASYTFSFTSTDLTMRTDGDLVLHDSTPPYYLWDSRTRSSKGAYLVVQDDCNVVIYNNNGNCTPLWHTATWNCVPNL